MHLQSRRVTSEHPEPVATTATRIDSDGGSFDNYCRTVAFQLIALVADGWNRARIAIDIYSPGEPAHHLQARLSS